MKTLGVVSVLLLTLLLANLSAGEAQVRLGTCQRQWDTLRD